jgi:DNA-binding response OmpR family regulator
MIEILFADDDAAMREMVGEVLRAAGFTVRLVTNGAHALEEIRSAPPALVLLDYHMGHPDGLAVCHELKVDPRLEHIPVLILTGQGGLEHRIRGFEAGADDYLAKPFDARELLARIRALLRLTEQGLYRNPTSGLPGGEAIRKDYSRRQESGQGFAACYFDLDDFKPFGDRFGFALADRVIRLAAECIARAAGDNAFVGHVGGDDFVALLPSDQARSRCRAAAEDFERRLRELTAGELLEDGHYRGFDREGRERLFPLTRLSVAILHIRPGVARGMEELGIVLAEAKRVAKTNGGISEVELTA